MNNLFLDNISIEETTKKNIENIALGKVRKAKRKKLVKTVTSIAASFAIVFCALWAVGFENVAKAAERIFYFIPGFGIQDESEEQPLMLKKIVSRKNEGVRITLVHAKTDVYSETMPCITFNLIVEYKDLPLEYEYNDYIFELQVGNKTFDVFSNVNVISEYQEVDACVIQEFRAYIGDAQIKSGEKGILKITSDSFDTIKIPFKLVTAKEASSYNIQTQTLGETEIVAVKYNVKLHGKHYTVVEPVITDIDEEYMDVVFKGNEEAVYCEWKVGNAYYFDSATVKNCNRVEVSNISYTQYIEDEIEIPIVGDGESASLDITYPFEHGTYKITGVSRSGNMYTIHSEMETEYDIWVVSPIVFLPYSSSPRGGYTADDGTYSFILSKDEQESSSMSITMHGVWYIVGDSVEFEFN